MLSEHEWSNMHRMRSKLDWHGSSYVYGHKNPVVAAAEQQPGVSLESCGRFTNCQYPFRSPL